jgi:hypothetical protein
MAKGATANDRQPRAEPGERCRQLHRARRVRHQLAKVRRVEYGRLDESSQVYLHYTGSGLHAASQIDAPAELKRSRALGNPHSNSPASLAATELVDRARRVVRDFCTAPPADYVWVVAANASAALCLVGASCRFAPGGTFALTAHSHNSVNGVWEFTRRSRRPSGSGSAWRRTSQTPTGSRVSCTDSWTGRWPGVSQPAFAAGRGQTAHEAA